MDNLTHTMVGACLGQAGLTRRTALATPALLIGANLPDLDILALFGGDDLQFAFRRGWTHGVLGLAVLPAVLVAVLVLANRWRRSNGAGAVPVHVPSLLVLAYGAALTHPLLDWFNTYGMRWLMPFDPTWSYGDTLFIVEPWIWLVLAFPLVLAARRRIGWWAVGGGLATALLISQVGLVTPATTVWTIGVVGIAAVRWGWRPLPEPAPVARAVLVVVVVYAAAMFAGSVTATRIASRWFAERGVPVGEIMASPVPANPVARDVVGVTADAYHFLRVGLGPDPRVRPAREPMVSDHGEVVEVARRAPQIAGFMSWIRYPSFAVIPRQGGYRVEIRDARYAHRFSGGFGTAWVELDSTLHVIDAAPNLR